MNQKYIKSFLLLVLFGNASCEKTICHDCDAPPPQYREGQIEGYIDDNKFKGSSVAYCYVEDDREPRDKSDLVGNLKARIYNWNEEIFLETDVFLQEKSEDDTEDGLKVIIYSSAFAPRLGQTFKIVRLNDKGEEIHTLAEMKRDDLPKNDFSFDCKKRPFVFPQAVK